MDLFETIEKLKEPDFRAGSTLWEEFQRSAIWLDFRKELQTWLADTWSLLETETDQDSIAELRGRARAIREVLQLPDNVISMIQANQEREE
jgi:hypothetical protein